MRAPSHRSVRDGLLFIAAYGLILGVLIFARPPFPAPAPAAGPATVAEAALR